MHLRSPRKRSPPLNPILAHGLLCVSLMLVVCRPGENHSPTASKCQSSRLLGEMKCTASASFVETSAEDIVPLLYRKKEKQSGFVFVEAGLQEHIP